MADYLPLDTLEEVSDLYTKTGQIRINKDNFEEAIFNYLAVNLKSEKDIWCGVIELTLAGKTIATFAL